MSSAAYPPTIYVLGTDKDIGKTVTCMGIIATLRSPKVGYQLQDIGYMKPVGQETLPVTDSYGRTIQADKDAVLLTTLLGITGSPYEVMSPVVWRDGETTRFMDEAAAGDPLVGREEYLERVRQAYVRVAEGKKVVIAEGTGQPGVGSVGGISNADVINALRAMVVQVTAILVTRGGIGATVDQLFPYLMALDHLGTRIDGVIINGVLMDKMDKVRQYLQTYYERVFPRLYGERLTAQGSPRILGYVPLVPELRLPSMRLLAEHFAREKGAAQEVIAPASFPTYVPPLVHDLKVISLAHGYESLLVPGDVVIVGANAEEVILGVLRFHQEMLREQGSGLAGLILSCKHVGGVSDAVRRVVAANDLPAITLDYDSAEIVQRVENLIVKVQPYDLMKKELIARTYQEHLDLCATFKWGCKA
jgi:hypothetical protein